MIINEIEYEILNFKEAKWWWDKAQDEVKRAVDLRFSNLKLAKNVIFFLGDGMGQTTVCLACTLDLFNSI